jgi:hypothetical protein
VQCTARDKGSSHASLRDGRQAQRFAGSQNRRKTLLAIGLLSLSLTVPLLTRGKCQPLTSGGTQSRLAALAARVDIPPSTGAPAANAISAASRCASRLARYSLHTPVAFKCELLIAAT